MINNPITSRVKNTSKSDPDEITAEAIVQMIIVSIILWDSSISEVRCALRDMKISIKRSFVEFLNFKIYIHHMSE